MIDKTEIINTDDGLETVDDAAPSYPRWKKAGQCFDLRVTEVGTGTNFDGDACLRVEGILLQKTTNFDKDKEVTLDPGTEVRINAGQPILERKLRRAERQYGGLVDRRLVITYGGLVKTSNGRTAKDFTVQVGADRVTYEELGI
jgi:hypothetical protein